MVMMMGIEETCETMFESTQEEMSGIACSTLEIMAIYVVPLPRKVVLTSSQGVKRAIREVKLVEARVDGVRSYFLQKAGLRGDYCKKTPERAAALAATSTTLYSTYAGEDYGSVAYLLQAGSGVAKALNKKHFHRGNHA